MEPGSATTGERFHLDPSPATWAARAPEWDALAARTPSPFVTHAWLDSWWEARGAGTRILTLLEADDGRLLAGAVFRRTRFGGLAGAADAHSGDWDAVAADDGALGRFWDRLAATKAPQIELPMLRADGATLAIAREALQRHGYRTHVQPGVRSPYLELPETYEELLAAASSNLRSQVGRRRRQLEKEGALEFLTVRDGPDLEPTLNGIFAVEASGWKAREGTAILTEPGSEQLYRSYAEKAAERGELRLYALTLDGRVIAGDIGIVTGGVGFLLKTGFDEDLSKRSPGLVLRGDVLRASIEEGLGAYDFLGPDDPYKTRWTDSVRPRVTLYAYRGTTLPMLAWRRRVRPALKQARDAIRARAADRG